MERLTTGGSPTGVSTVNVSGETRDPRRDGNIFVISAVIEGFLRAGASEGEGGGVGISVGIEPFLEDVAALLATTASGFVSTEETPKGRGCLAITSGGRVLARLVLKG